MNLKLRGGQKLLFVFTFLFVYLFIPFNNVSANIIWGTTSEEINEVNMGCARVTGRGPLNDIFEAGESILTQPYVGTSCALENNVTGVVDINNLDSGKGSLLTVAVGATQTLIDQKPASGVDYIQDKVYALTNFGTVSAQDPQTYYPGAGADLLRPIQAFWGWSVNFVFSFLILLILAIAFAIIFRQRLGGAADVTIQNSIPNIAMALILVPLSYAISGLFIDAVTLGTNAVHGFLLGPGAPGREVYDTRNDPTSGGGTNCTPYDPNDVTTENCDRGLYADDERINIWNVRGKVSISDEIGNVIGSTIDGANTNDTAVSIVVGIFNVITGIINIIGGGNVNQYAWIGTIINFFISLLTIWISIKIAWHLFQKFLTFLLMPIFAPFIFATVAFPGNGLKSVINYSKQMGSASLAYIVTYMMFILTIVFTSEGFQSQFPDIRTGGYVPPLLGLNGILNDVQGTGVTSLVLSLVGIGIFFSIPNVLKSIDKSLGVQFALPQFIKDPFVNMKESFGATYGLASRGVGFARYSGEGALKTIKATQDGKGLVNRLRARSQLGYDKSLGLAPSDKGSARYTKFKELNQKRQKENAALEAGKKLLQSKTPGDRARGEEMIKGAQRNLGKIQKEAELFDIKGFYGEDVKAPRFKVSFEFEDIFKPPYSRQTLRTLSELIRDARVDNPIDLDFGKVVFEAEEFEFDPNFTLVRMPALERTTEEPEGAVDADQAVVIDNERLATKQIAITSFGDPKKGPINAVLAFKARRITITDPKKFKIGTVLKVTSPTFFTADAKATGSNILKPLSSITIEPSLRFKYNELLSNRFFVSLEARGDT